MDTVYFILSLVFDQLMSPVWLVFGFITAHLNLALLSILTGVGFSLPQIYGLKNPKGFADAARSFPRWTIPGRMLIGLAALWFLYNVRAESLADFAACKQYPIIFGGHWVVTSESKSIGACDSGLGLFTRAC